MTGLFDGKVAIVTGAGNGIGRAAALLFAKEGARVTVADISREGGHETVELIKAAGGEAMFVDGDVASIDVVRAMVAQTVAKYGRLDCAFNNAGITHPKDNEWDDDAFERTLAVNVRGVMQCMKYEIPEMLKVGGGAVVNTASISGLITSAEPSLPGYTASKHAVIGLTKVAALKHARQNIRVNCICPGVILTNMVKQVMEISEEVKHKLENMAPMGRLGRPEEIAEVAIWLASHKSSFVTGHALVADGGFVAQ